MKKRIKYFPQIFIKNLINILRKSSSKEMAVSKLKEKYLLNDKQIDYIMGYSLKKLIQEINIEYKDFINGLISLE
jgi:DNA gyrase/topoisomerase IV subunit A